jgi:hypothetical protein
LGVIYHDEVERIDGRWLITYRYVEPVWRAGDYPVHWLQPTETDRGGSERFP